MKHHFVKPGSKFKLKDCSPWDTGDFDPKSGEEDAKEKSRKTTACLDELQEKLYADAGHSLLIVLQGTDTSGKDGVIRHVTRDVSPQGCRVTSFKVPTQEEAAHDYLWRVHREAPPKGSIGIFNRSHYEDVIVPKVHGLLSEKTVAKRYRHINEFERLLAHNGTTILKFFLHISKKEQKERLQARADDPKKRWKFNITDVHERKFWGRYQDAFETMIRETSTDYAPWIVVPADYKWYRDYVVGKAVVRALEDMDLKYPPGPKGVNFDKIRIR